MSEDARKTVCFRVDLTRKEYNVLVNMAREDGITRSALFRRLLKREQAQREQTRMAIEVRA